MSKPRMLDTFCKAGGATKGYQRAGWYVVGVDKDPQPRYCGDEFYQADALEFIAAHGREFDAIHASPPCQAYTVAANIHGPGEHPRLIEPVRNLLQASDLPYVIENVPGAPLRNWVVACGLAFGLNVKRHRWFESNYLLLMPPCARHDGDWVLVFGHTVLERSKQLGRTAKNGPILRRRHLGTDVGRRAMGIDWMTRDELSEAIPPAYTECIGAQLMAHLERAA